MCCLACTSHNAMLTCLYLYQELIQLHKQVLGLGLSTGDVATP